FEYHPPIVLGALDPPTGPATGGTLVSISLAFSFDPVRDASVSCFFNGTVVPATVVSNTSVECIAPPTIPNGGTMGAADVAASASVAGRALEFFYLPDQAEMSVFPPSGPIKGGTLVEVSSRHIADAVAALFSYEAVEGFADASQFNSTNSGSYFPSRLPPYSAVCSFSTDGNGSGDSAFYYRPEPYVFGVDPAYGPVTGGNPVRVEGAAFRQEGRPGSRSDEMVRCRFGDQEVGATVHAAGLLSCRAPPMPA
ncbi:unnamed protein product, partial [Hapterophycus canaliculatus]